MQQIRYEDYKRLIAGRAHHWARLSRTMGKTLPTDELMSEGNLEFVKAVEKFEPERKCQFSTLLTIRLDRRYHNIVYRSVSAYGGKHRPYDSKRESDSLLAQMPDHNSNPEHLVAFVEMIKGLPRDAQIIVECVLNTPTELIQMLRKKNRHVKVTRYSLERYFTDKKGWRISRVRRAITHVQGALGQL